MTTWRMRQLGQMFDRQNSLCCYCDGQTWMPGRETKQEAMLRLGITSKVHGARKMLIAAKATREHVQRIADGAPVRGTVKVLKMACHSCNVRRGDSEPEVHRMDMQVLVAAGLHPTNRPRVVDSPAEHLKMGLKALKKLRAGQPIATTA